MAERGRADHRARYNLLWQAAVRSSFVRTARHAPGKMTAARRMAEHGGQEYWRRGAMQVETQAGLTPAGKVIGKARLLLDSIKFEHTIFALPFAYLGMALAARGTHG